MSNEPRTDLPAIGTDIVLKADFESFPLGIWKPGERGTVAIAEDGQIGLKLETRYPELDEWDNCLMWYSDAMGQTQAEMISEFWGQCEETAPAPQPGR